MAVNNEIVLQDVFYHLTKLKGDFTRHKIENNKNHLSVYAMTHFRNKIELIEQVIEA